ncbi:ADP-ribosylation factor GTPase-activating protein AGD1 [Zea mays]|uniref:ADP-ribosylation factor GTPase-activating protein AGD1 n=1 Tax=Zea mays TaxID=4577 RepID=A0A1D6KIZ4_MAIZE|nr:ADP-ribosylation factor GTPase-activating protein AGD1 [Zea mays]
MSLNCPLVSEGLGEAYDGDIAFASSLETFGGGHNDPISVAFGGPVMTKFTIALREIGTYKEVMRSQVECLLNDRLLNFVDIDLHDVNDAHKRFDKASLSYDQVSYLIMTRRCWRPQGSSSRGSSPWRISIASMTSLPATFCTNSTNGS